MTGEIAQQAVDAVLRSAITEGYRKVKLKYAGGEPSLRMPDLFSLHDDAAVRCKGEAIRLHAVMLTNGTLLDVDAIEGLKARGGIGRVMISLDGLSEISAKQRPFTCGLGGAGSSRELSE